MADVTKLTAFPNGVAQFTFFGIGATAGDVTIPGVLATDRILRVQSIALTTGVPSATADLTAEFSVSAADTINNDGGTSTANMIVACTVSRAKGT